MTGGEPLNPPPWTIINTATTGTVGTATAYPQGIWQTSTAVPFMQSTAVLPADQVLRQFDTMSNQIRQLQERVDQVALFVGWIQNVYPEVWEQYVKSTAVAERMEQK